MASEEPIEIHEEHWVVAERVCGSIVDILNQEFSRMREANQLEPPQLLAGLMMAVVAVQESMPKGNKPASLEVMLNSVRNCLANLIEAEEKMWTAANTATARPC